MKDAEKGWAKLPQQLRNRKLGKKHMTDTTSYAA